MIFDCHASCNNETKDIGEDSVHDSHDYDHGQLFMVMIMVAILSQLQKESNQEAVLQPKAIHPPPLEC